LPRSTLSHVLGSTTMFVNVVNALIAGTLGALVADAAGAGAAVVALVGVVCGLVYLGACLEYGRRTFRFDPDPV
jgi:hypothetical protein